jgi:hypothetical protein
MAITAPAAAHPGGSYWSFERALTRIDGAKVAVAGRRVAVDAAVTTCGGWGGAIRRNGTRRWKHFTCIVATLRPTGRDIVFQLHVLSRTRFVMTNAHYVNR